MRPLKSQTLSATVYERLRSDIVLGRLRPGDMLLEGELADRLEVSRTPIREALQQLAKDGLIGSQSRRWLVVQPTIEEIHDIYEVRAALEGFAARLAVDNATDEKLTSILAALESRAHAGPSAVEFVTSNEQFHRAIFEAAGNQRLLYISELNKHFYFNVRIARLYRPEDLAASHAEHTALVNAIQSRDSDRADLIARNHVMNALAIIEQRSGL